MYFAHLFVFGAHERRAERVLAAGGSVSFGVGGEGWRRAERVLAEGGSVSCSAGGEGYKSDGGSLGGGGECDVWDDAEAEW